MTTRLHWQEGLREVLKRKLERASPDQLKQELCLLVDEVTKRHLTPEKASKLLASRDREIDELRRRVEEQAREIDSLTAPPPAAQKAEG